MQLCLSLVLMVCIACSAACFLQENFQKTFWKLRQTEWQPYTLLHSPLHIEQVRALQCRCCCMHCAVNVMVVRGAASAGNMLL